MAHPTDIHLLMILGVRCVFSPTRTATAQLGLCAYWQGPFSDQIRAYEAAIRNGCFTSDSAPPTCAASALVPNDPITGASRK